MFIFTANAVARQDNLEFLEDVVPKTIPFKNVKSSSLMTQARLRGDIQTGDDSTVSASLRPLSSSHATDSANRTTTNGDALINGDAALSFLQSPAQRDRQAARAAAAAAAQQAEAEEDPSSQLETEMRQAHNGANHDGDVDMTG